jgi:hypothetical protein
VLDDLNTLGAASTDGEFLVATGAGAFAYESGATARTSMGVGSTDTPTMAGLTLSHADNDVVLNLLADTDNDGTGEAYIYIKNGTTPTVEGWIGTIPATNQAPDGSAFTGTTTNALLFGVAAGNDPIMIGGGEVGITVYGGNVKLGSDSASPNGGVHILHTTDKTALLVEGDGTQTSAILSVIDSTSNPLLNVSGSATNYAVGVGTATPAARVDVINDTAAQVCFRVQGAAAQSSSVLLIENSAGTDLLRLAPGGQLNYGLATASYLGASGEIWSAASVTVAGIPFNYVGFSDAVDDGGFVGVGNATTTESRFQTFYDTTAAVLNQPSWYVGGEKGDMIIHPRNTNPTNFFEIVNVAGSTVFNVASASSYVSLLNGTGVNEFSTDGTLGGDSDDALPTEKAVKAYVDGAGAFTDPNSHLTTTTLAGILEELAIVTNNVVDEWDSVPAVGAWNATASETVNEILCAGWPNASTESLTTTFKVPTWYDGEDLTLIVHMSSDTSPSRDEATNIDCIMYDWTDTGGDGVSMGSKTTTALDPTINSTYTVNNVMARSFTISTGLPTAGEMVAVKLIRTSGDAHSGDMAVHKVTIESGKLTT